MVGVPPSVRLRQAGVTFIELMIAMVVALVLLAALAVMYGSSIKARNDIERNNRQIENGRFAIQLLRDDVQLAGFFGELNMVQRPPAPPMPGALPDVCVTHLSALPTDGVVATDVTHNGGVLDALDYLAVSMNLHVQGFDNVDPADPALPDCIAGISDLRPNTDIIVVRRVHTCAAADCAGMFNAGAPHLQVSQCYLGTDPEITDTPFFLRADANTTAFTLRTELCLTANRTPIRRYVTHIYYIAENNVAGDGIPTLKRLELRASGWTTTALVEGIEDLQVEYGVDGNDETGDDVIDSPSTADGSPDEYVDDPTAAATLVSATTAQAAWASAMTVRLHVLSRSVDKRTGYLDSNTYQLGSKTIVAADDLTDEERAHPRQVFQTVITMRNAQGRRQ